MSYDELSGKIIGCAIEVHRVLGPGLLESAYEHCLVHELAEAGICAQSQVSIPIKYKDVQLDVNYLADIVVEGKLILELKSVTTMLPIFEAQILTYMKLGGYRTGLLINFNVRLLKDGLKRFVL